jgi:hypothetical protein
VGGLYGVGFELNYNPAIIQVSASSGGSGNVLQLCHATPPNRVPLEVFDGVPDTDGVHRVDSVDLAQDAEESGSGRVWIGQIECLTAGQTTLTLTDTSTGGGEFMGVLGDAGAIIHIPVAEFEATVNCVPGATFGAARVASAGLGVPDSRGQGGGPAPAVPADPQSAVAGAAVPAPAAAPAAEGQAPARLPSAGGEPFSIAGQSSSTMLMVALATGMMAAAIAITWVVGRRQED